MDDVRLIDANALKEKMTVGALGGHLRIWVCGVIDDAPTVNAVPVKRGKWIAVTSYDAFGGDAVQWEVHGNPIAYHYCSECKNQSDVDENGDEIIPDFCPNCGADMRGDTNA